MNQYKKTAELKEEDMSLGKLLTTGGVGLLTGGKSDPLSLKEGGATILKQFLMRGVKGLAGQTDWLENFGLSPGSSDSDNKP